MRSVCATEADGRAPFRIERRGDHVELVHHVAGGIDRYALSPLHLLVLKQDAASAIDAIALNALAGRPGHAG